MAPAADADYTVVLADVIRSRRNDEGGAVQRALEEACRELDGAYREELAAALTITAGDELQALLHRPARAFDLVFDVADLLHPLEVRFGVGKGALTTELRPTTGSLAGPAFYRAREGMEESRSGRRHVTFRGFGPGTETITVLADTAAAIADRWTSAQRESARAYLEHGSHRAAAESIGKDRSTVTRNLQRALASEVVTIRTHLRALLAPSEAG